MSLLTTLLTILLGFSSPGDSIGWTTWPWQWTGQTANQVWFDGNGIHVAYTGAHRPDYNDRNCIYNFWLEGQWYGDLRVSNYYAGYTSCSAMPVDRRGVCSYQRTSVGGKYKPWIAIDDDQGGYSFTERVVLPQATYEDLIYSRMAVDSLGNIHLVTYSRSETVSYYTRSTDEGATWSDGLVVNSDKNYHQISAGVFTDHFNNPGKIIVYWTQWTGELSGWSGRLCQDVWYMISTDYGQSWGPKTNITEFTPSDSIRAYTHLKAIFDGNGDPHFVFPGCYFNGTNPTDRKSWIVHLSPSSGLSFVAGPHILIKYPGGGRLPCDYSNTAIDRDNGYLYCTYVVNRDEDTSAIGDFNGEIFAVASTDNGLNWWSNAPGDTGVNLTRSQTPGAPPGQCCDDDYPSMYPYVETINGIKSLIISYPEGKGGDYSNPTNNPYRVYFVPCELIIRVEEESGWIPVVNDFFEVSPNPMRQVAQIKYRIAKNSKIRADILDINGRVVEHLLNRFVSAGCYSIKFVSNLPSGVYFIKFEVDNRQLTKPVTIIR